MEVAAASPSPAVPLEELNKENIPGIYSPLSDHEIRVSLLHPASEFDAPIECSLIRAPADGSVKYTALSYVWGSISHPGTILLNGREYRVTQNLEQALRWLRHETENLHIWIDAITINQCDIAEKNIQVRMMSRIYSAAERTIVWLGEGIKVIHGLLARVLLIDALQDIDHCYEHLGMRNEEAFQGAFWAMFELSQLPYWTRAGVVQETKLSQSVVLRYGALQVEWDLFTRFWEVATRFVQLALEQENVGFKDIEEVQKMKYVHGHLSTIIPVQLLTPGSEFEDGLDYDGWVNKFCGLRQCQDPRDLVYACYGLFPRQIRERLSIDYNKSNEDVFLEATKAFMAWKNSVECINQCRFSTSSSKLPTWVPQYDEIGATVTFVPYLQYPRGAARMEFHDLHEGGKLLEVLGFELGHCTRHCDPEELPAFTSERQVYQLGIVDDLAQRYNAIKSQLKVNPRRLNELALAFGGCGFRLTTRGLDIELLLRATTIEESAFPGQEAVDTLIKRGADPMLIWGYHQQCLMFQYSLIGPMEDFRVDSRTDGYGLGPANIQTGDKIVLIVGCKIPVALRKSGERYSLVGNVFVPDYLKLRRDLGHGFRLDSDPVMQRFFLI